MRMTLRLPASTFHYFTSIFIRLLSLQGVIPPSLSRCLILDDFLLGSRISCAKMPISALDSRLFRDLFGTKEIRNVFEDQVYTWRMVEGKVALARIQSKIGIILDEAGETLTKELGNQSFQ